MKKIIEFIKLNNFKMNNFKIPLFLFFLYLFISFIFFVYVLFCNGEFCSYIFYIILFPFSIKHFNSILSIFNVNVYGDIWVIIPILFNSIFYFLLGILINWLRQNKKLFIIVVLIVVLWYMFIFNKFDKRNEAHILNEDGSIRNKTENNIEDIFPNI